MRLKDSTPLVISLGGSLVSTPNGVNVEYLKKFKSVIEEQLKTGRRIFVVVGGGAVCRTYYEALTQLTSSSEEDRHWLGIYVTRVNAFFLKLLFGSFSYDSIITSQQEFNAWMRNQIARPSNLVPLVVSSGWVPGHSTDGVAVKIAQAAHAATIVNLTNIDYVYSADPKKDTSAKPLPKMSWSEYLKLVPKDHTPGGNYPFDPVASKLAQESGIKVVIMNGENVENFGKYLNEEKWKGTMVGDSGIARG